MVLLYLFTATVSHRYVSALKGTSSANTTDTLQQEAQQNELPDVKFISVNSVHYVTRQAHVLPLMRDTNFTRT